MTTYEVMGFATQAGADTNTDPNTQGTGTKPELSVIYTTDDLAEVEKILEAGGYVDANDVYFVAEGYRVDSDLSDAAMPRKAEFVPDNSTATIDNTGTVRTDKQKQPLTQVDVEQIAVEEQDIPRKRNIVDHDGGL